MSEPTLDDLVERLVGLVERQTEILLEMAAIVAPKRRTVTVCADELRTGDRIVSDRDPDIVNTVATKPEWVTRYRQVQLILTTDSHDLVDRVADADDLFVVLKPRPVPIYSDDPFGTPNTLAVSPYGTLADQCDGGSLPREARR